MTDRKIFWMRRTMICINVAASIAYSIANALDNLGMAMDRRIRRRLSRRTRFDGPPPPQHPNCRCVLQPVKIGDLPDPPGYQDNVMGVLAGPVVARLSPGRIYVDGREFTEQEFWDFVAEIESKGVTTAKMPIGKERRRIKGEFDA